MNFVRPPPNSNNLLLTKWFSFFFFICRIFREQIFSKLSKLWKLFNTLIVWTGLISPYIWHLEKNFDGKIKRWEQNLPPTSHFNLIFWENLRKNFIRCFLEKKIAYLAKKISTYLGVFENKSDYLRIPVFFRIIRVYFMLFWMIYLYIILFSVFPRYLCQKLSLATYKTSLNYTLSADFP
jgi:phage shock protein PspC (stress-responsive transcriptional regulator)